ncbi:restriction endonuclease subunit S [Streptococcus sobrinus]|uniref:restriction endonuclease subunit S n=1 Tax=Streptococcus sobrinus TaxID=1310 RepID=UPI000304222A|nr:restriction endonuclease subunit S [Streptococcus sobrinus]
MTMQSKPLLRFKDFNDEWKKTKVSEIGNKIYGGGTPKTSEESYWDGNLNWIQSSDLVEHDIFLSDTNKKITNEGLINSAAKLISKDSITIVTRVGVGKLSLVPFDFATSQDFLSISDLNFNKNFSSYLLYKVVQHEKRNVQGTSIKGITKDELLSKKLFVTNNFDEQSAIGELFSTLDDLLLSYKDNLTNYQSFKSAMLSKMFPKHGQTVPEIRLAGFDGEWERTKLGALGSVAMNKRIFKDETSEDGEIPFYKIGTFGGVADSFISRARFEEYKQKYPYPEIGDILISASGSIGRTVEYMGEEAYYQDSNIVWLKHDNRLVNSFLKQFYSIVKWNGIEGTTIKRLYNKNILETEIPLPSLEEQQAIGELFSNLDDLISSTQSKIGELKTLKKKLLREMFI